MIYKKNNRTVEVIIIIRNFMWDVCFGQIWGLYMHAQIHVGSGLTDPNLKHAVKNLRNSQVILDAILKYFSYKEEYWKSSPLKGYKVINATTNSKYAALIHLDPDKEKWGPEIHGDRWMNENKIYWKSMLSWTLRDRRRNHFLFC